MEKRSFRSENTVLQNEAREWLPMNLLLDTEVVRYRQTSHWTTAVGGNHCYGDHPLPRNYRFSTAEDGLLFLYLDLASGAREPGRQGGQLPPPPNFLSEGDVYACAPPKFWQSLGISTCLPPPPPPKKKIVPAPLSSL